MGGKMSRVKENEEWMERQPKTFTGKSEDIDLKTKMCIYTALLDISRSLAVIADKMAGEDKNASDAYVRDKIMIDWFMDYYIPLCSDENLMKEEVYRKWMNDMGGKLDGK